MPCSDVSKIEISQTVFDKIGKYFHRRRKFDEEEGIRSFEQIAEMIDELNSRKTEVYRIRSPRRSRGKT